MISDNYFIKEGYIPQDKNYTLSEESEEKYWTEERIKLSHYFQYSVYDLARRKIKELKLKSVLDVGCGCGTKLYKLIYPLTTDITGIDQKHAIDICKRIFENKGVFLKANLEKTDLQLKRKYDLIICSDVIEHLIEPNNILEFIRTHSHEKTIILLSTPERDNLRGKDCLRSNKPEHVREWNKSEFAQYIESRGFKIILHKLIAPMKFNFSKEFYTIFKHIFLRRFTFKTQQLLMCQINTRD